MLTALSIFIEIRFSTLVYSLYGLIQRILCLISVAPYCKFNGPLVEHCVITKGPLYGVS